MFDTIITALIVAILTGVPCWISGHFSGMRWMSRQIWWALQGSHTRRELLDARNMDDFHDVIAKGVI